MDDSVSILASEEESVILIQYLKELWMRAGMYPRKLLSNSKKELGEVDMENRDK